VITAALCDLIVGGRNGGPVTGLRDTRKAGLGNFPSTHKHGLWLEAA
jgi:hypothetical protein